MAYNSSSVGRSSVETRMQDFTTTSRGGGNIPFHKISNGSVAVYHAFDNMAQIVDI
jgi:hypothetical protein